MASIEDIKFEFCFHETIITCGVDLLLGIIDPITEACHGTVNLTRVVPSEKQVNRKRRTARNKIGIVKKVYLCDYCDYGSNAKYMMDRHVRRIHEHSADRQKCKFSNFTSMYPFNIKGHVTRAHKDGVEMSDSSNLPVPSVRPRRRVILSDSSSCHTMTKNTVEMPFENAFSEVNSFWAM